jgi:crotonobetainyl-CoA:carnitine CoA-transferase CaiB-like acyl-CoA transferase
METQPAENVTSSWGTTTPAVAALTVVDLGRGRPTALVAKHFAEMGATVFRISPPGGDPLREASPGFGVWGKQVIAADISALDDLVRHADICLVGGEDHPDLDWCFDPEALRLQNERLITVSIGAFSGPPTDNDHAVEVLVQARTGLTFEHFEDEPVLISTSPGIFGSALLAIIGTWAALLSRTRTGKGQSVRTSMEDGVAFLWSQLWMTAKGPSDTFDIFAPKDMRHLVFECKGGDYLQFTFGTPGSVAAVYDILGINKVVDPDDKGGPDASRGAANYFGDCDLMTPYVKAMDREALLSQLWAKGIAAEPVLAPGECWADQRTLPPSLIHESEHAHRFVGSPLSFMAGGEVPEAGSGRTVAHQATDGAPAQDSTGEAPLTGVRILDFGDFVAGPFASRILADLGAAVTKIERVHGAPGPVTFRNLLTTNRGKQKIRVDLKSDEGMEVVRRLCANADVVHHNFRVGVPERLGLDARSLRATHPNLIVQTATAYGLTGPKATRSGFDMSIAAFTGHYLRSGGRGNLPLWYRIPLIDYVCGALGAVGIMVSLYERATSGAIIDSEVSLLSASLFLLSELVETPTGDFVGAPPLDHQRRGFHPAEHLYQTSDGWIALCVPTERIAARVFETLGLELAVRPLQEWNGREGNGLTEILRGETSATAVKAAREAGAWAEVCTPDALVRLFHGEPYAHPYVVRFADPDHGEIAGCFGPFVTFSDWVASGQVGTVARAGAHTRELLAGLGYRPEDIEDLYSRGHVA